MKLSPWKKKKIEWNLIPQYDDLAQALVDSYTSKAKDRMKLPVVRSLNWYNKKNEKEWLSSLLEDEALSLVSYFCYGTGTVPILLKAISIKAGGTNDNNIPGFQLFEEKLTDAQIYKVEDQHKFKSLLLEAVRNSYYFNTTTTTTTLDNNKRHPVAILLSNTNEQHGNGWLFNLGHKQTKSRTYRDKFLATALYNILGGGCRLDYCDILATALGSKANSPIKRKRWIQCIARDTAKEIVEMNMNNNSSSNTSEDIMTTTTTTTATTAPTVSISSASSSSSSVVQQKKPPSVVTKNLDYDRMVMSPLTGHIQTSERNFFPASPKEGILKDIQANASFDLAVDETDLSLAFSQSPSKATSNNTPPSKSKTSSVLYSQAKMQYKTPSNQLSTTSSNRSPTTPSADMSFDNNESPAVKLFEEKTSRPAPSPAWFGSPVIQKKDKRRRRSLLVSPDRFSLHKILSPLKQSKVRKEKLPQPPPPPPPTPPPTPPTPPIPPTPTTPTTPPTPPTPPPPPTPPTPPTPPPTTIASAPTLVIIDKQKFGDDSMVGNFIDKLGTATNCRQLVDCAVNFLSIVASSSNSNNCVTGKYNMLIKVAKPKKLKDDSKPSSQRRYIRNKSKEMCSVLSAAIPNSDLRKDVLSYILKRNYSADVYFDEVKQQKLSVEDCIAVRMRGGHGVSNGALDKMLQDFVRFLKYNNMLRVNNPLPGSLRAKMGKAEGFGSIPVDHEMIMCNTAKDKTESCLHYFIKNIPLLVEKLVASCISQDKFEDSILFSRLISKIVLGIGGDRGGGDLSNLLRLMNRKDGNCARYSIPISVVEKAGEDYDVLKTTILNKRARNLIQPILSDQLSMIIMHFSNANDVQCFVVRFIRDGQPVKIQPDISFLQDHECALDGFVFDSIANSRTEWNNFDVSNTMENTEIDLECIPITNSDGACIGIKLQLFDGTSISHQFESSIVNETSFVLVECNQIIGMPIVDGKYGACTYGQSTCSVGRPCFRCLWHKDDRSPPMWLSSYGFDQCHEVELRVGASSRPNCWKRFQSLTGKNRAFLVNQDNLTKDIREDCKSISKAPLLYVNNLAKHHGEPMHVAQGVTTHLNDEVYKKLNVDVDDSDGDFFLTQADECLKSIYDTVELEKCQLFRNAKSAHGRIQRQVKKAMDDLKVAEEDGNENSIQSAEETLLELENERDQHNLESEYEFNVCLIRGAKEFEKAINESENNSNTRMTKQAFLFRSAVRMYAGFFTAMHSSMELSGRRGIRVLDHRQKVYDLVVNGGYSPATKAIVIEIMDTWLALGSELLPISIICNDQEKQDESKIAKLESHIVAFIKLWMPFVTYKNWQFWKLHALLCNATAFIKEYGMLGRANAQGFESKHYEMAQHKKTMGRISERKLRVQKLAERQQACFVPGLTESLNFLQDIDESKKRGPRGKYNTTANRTKLAENIQIHEEEDDAPEGYFTSVEGNYIPSKWKQLYHFVQFGKAPAEWRTTFEDNDEIGAVDTESAAYMQPMSGR